MKCTGCLESNVSSSSEFGPIVLASKLFLPIFEETGVAIRTSEGLFFFFKLSILYWSIVD